MENKLENKAVCTITLISGERLSIIRTSKNIEQVLNSSPGKFQELELMRTEYGEDEDQYYPSTVVVGVDKILKIGNDRFVNIWYPKDIS